MDTFNLLRFCLVKGVLLAGVQECLVKGVLLAGQTTILIIRGRIECGIIIRKCGALRGLL